MQQEERLKGAPVCPACQNHSDGWTALEEGTEPHHNDLSICGYCQTILQYKLAGGAYTMEYCTLEAIRHFPFNHKRMSDGRLVFTGYRVQ